jgi:tRNA modification GTPase
MQKMEMSEIILLIIDASSQNYIKQINEIKELYPKKKIIPIVNKSDKLGRINPVKLATGGNKIIYLSAKLKQNINELEEALFDTVKFESSNLNSTIITNTRHLELLQNALDASNRVENGLASGLSSDFIAQDIREILNNIGLITGEYTNDEVLGNIFKNFCIGK